ncbi:MAG: hypothetical protein ACPGTO_03915 [Polaribacter sp.]
MNESKEQIKNRMIKNAATLWGVPANEIEMSFDPVISLLLSACASEIEKISEKINESQTRVTEKIIQLMTPETIFGPRPAHCIIQTEPLEEAITITPDFLFSLKRKDTEKASKKYRDIFFSPIQNFKVVKSNIQYLAFEDTISEITKFKERDVLLKTTENFAEKSVLYIGLATKLDTIKFKNTSVYFELQDFETTRLFYHHLKNAKWFHQDKEIKTTAGFYNSEREETMIVDSVLNEGSIKVANIIEQVRNNYKRHYVTITENINPTKKIPTEFEEVIEKNKVKIDPNTTWIKIVFPSIIDKSILENLYCSFNSFPVINTKLEEFSYQLKEFINIVPIKTSSLFLDVKSISNLEDKKYKLLNKSVTNTNKGIYSVKTDSISKVDNRKAKEYITHLIELLKSESASFSYLNNSFLHANLKKLNQIISLLENKISSSSSNEDIETHYVSVIPYKPKETLTIEYWNTDGSFANNIKYGSSLKNYKATDLKQKSSFLVTSTYNGRDSLNMEERLQAYRRTLLSRNKVVTKEDVKLICFEFFSDKIKNVEIKNGYTVDVSLHKGMINCIEIILTTNKEEDIDPFEWDFIKNNLLLYLEKNATAVFPFVIKKR